MGTNVNQGLRKIDAKTDFFQILFHSSLTIFRSLVHRPSKHRTLAHFNDGNILWKQAIVFQAIQALHKKMFDESPSAFNNVFIFDPSKSF